MQPYTSNRLLRRAMLRAGIAPRHAARLQREWDEHAEDVLAQLRASGHSLETAEAQARSAVGDWQALAASVADRQDLRSFSHRLPWVAFVVGPIALLIGLVLATVFSVAAMAWSFQDAGLPVPGWFADAQSVLFWAVRSLVPLALAVIIALVAARRFSPAFWPLLGMVIVLVLGAALGLSAELDRLTATGNVAVSLSFVPPYPDVCGSVGRLAFGVCVVVVPYLAWWRGLSAQA